MKYYLSFYNDNKCIYKIDEEENIVIEYVLYNGTVVEGADVVDDEYLINNLCPSEEIGKNKYELLKKLYTSEIKRNDIIEILSVYDELMDFVVKYDYVDTIEIARLTYKLSYDEVDDLIGLLLNEGFRGLLDHDTWKRYNKIFDYLIFLKAIKAFQD